MTLNNKIIAISLLAVTALASCKDDDDSTPPAKGITTNEEEVITTVDVILTDTLGNRDTVSFNDLDGDGGNLPTIDTLKLDADMDYTVNLEFKDASDPNDVEDITTEIEAEDDEHLVCFEVNNATGINIQRTDSDGVYEVGLKSLWMINSTASSTNGSVRISLKHQPDNAKDGSCSVGDTDVEIDFPVVIL